jgi:hypothetical protein
VNDDTRDLTNAQIVELVSDALISEFRPFREVVERLLTVVERLQHRVELLELEQLHTRPAPGERPGH